MNNRVYKFVLPLLGLWLVGWIVLSWAAIQDDALIHLRYADNLFRTHLITYDGVHPSYGASSLLYVHLLAFLRGFITSPNLPRGVSSFMHLLLFLGTAFILLKFIPRESARARLLSVALLCILVMPSAVRWLDDGMETGFALCFVALLCVFAFRQTRCKAPTALQYLSFTVLAFFMVLLRTELSFLCGIVFLILAWKQIFSGSKPSSRWWSAILHSSHVLLGSLLALAFIVWRMHALLPDTALAKSSGIPTWQAFSTAATVLGGALTFGVGLLLLWLLTLILLFRAGTLSIPTLFANIVFPAVLALSALRGQEIQGARYLVWAYFFSTLWNLLELGSIDSDRPPVNQSYPLIYGFFVVLLLMLPIECKVMYRVLSTRVRTMKEFQGQHLDVLQGKQGIASDVGYIGYFSKANICDMAGLVNGRAAARLNKDERLAACVATRPDFIFGNVSQLKTISNFMPIESWQVCTHYDFGNVRTPDTHYLLLPEATAAETCKAIAGSSTFPLASLFTQP
ncbi:hypothetical protein P8936_13970 [Edaphobacter paludis]|uniref:Glycosyltransferase RgtA/B/C/D-like domain-containing protein n=1 Tax=Edaphobacter paludis TaxID=3035702 RepID=A0AAU7CWZ2_9BACT